MKKIFLLLVAVFSAVLLTGCKDFMVDAPAVHNGLVDRIDALLLDEKNFYDASMALTEGDSNKAFDDAYVAFENSAGDLDDYYKNTTFHSTQQSFVDVYNQSFKPFIVKYLAAAKAVKEIVDRDGYNYEKMKAQITELDKYSQDFEGVNSKLVDTINLQSDTL